MFFSPCFRLCVEPWRVSCIEQLEHTKLNKTSDYTTANFRMDRSLAGTIIDLINFTGAFELLCKINDLEGRINDIINITLQSNHPQTGAWSTPILVFYEAPDKEWRGSPSFWKVEHRASGRERHLDSSLGQWDALNVRLQRFAFDNWGRDFSINNGSKWNSSQTLSLNLFAKSSLPELRQVFKELLRPMCVLPWLLLRASWPVQWMQRSRWNSWFRPMHFSDYGFCDKKRTGSRRQPFVRTVRQVTSQSRFVLTNLQWRVFDVLAWHSRTSYAASPHQSAMSTRYNT